MSTFAKQFGAYASAAVMALSAAPAMAGGPQGVVDFLVGADAKGEVNLKGAATKYGKQLYVDSAPAQVETKSCNSDLEVRYIEKANQGTFWGLEIDSRDKGINVDRAPKHDEAKVIRSGDYIAIEIGNQTYKLSDDWKDVISENVKSLRAIFPDGSDCPKGSKPQPSGGGGEELPGPGCQTGCSAVDARSVKPWAVGVPGFTMAG